LISVNSGNGKKHQKSRYRVEYFATAVNSGSTFGGSVADYSTLPA